MLNAYTPDMFEENYREAIEKCKQKGMTGKILKNLEIFKKKQQNFAMYEIQKTPGTCQNTTSNYAEANHASVCYHLGKNFCSDVEQLVMELLRRQKKLSDKIKELIIREDSSMKSERSRLMKKKYRDKSIIDAATHLNKKGYKKFLEVYNNHVKYVRKELTADNGSNLVQIYYPQIDGLNTIREFNHPDCPCSCVDSVSYGVQCVHRFALLLRFNLADFDIRYHRREKPTKSFNLGNYSSNHIFSELVTKNLNIKVGPNTTIAQKYIEISDGRINNYTEKIPSNITSNISEKKSLPSNPFTEEKLNHLYMNGWFNYSEFLEVANRLYEGMKRNRKFGTLMCGQMLKNVDFFDKFKSMDDIPSDFNSMEMEFLERIDEHKTMFTTETTTDILFASNLELPSPVRNAHHASKKRFKPTSEIVMANVRKARENLSTQNSQITYTKAVTNVKKTKKCTFCKSVSCGKKTGCSVKEKYGNIINNASGYIKYLQDDAPYREIKIDEKNSFIQKPNFKESKHIQIIDLICKTKKHEFMRPSEELLLAKINGINDNGHIIGTLENVLIEINELADITTKVVSIAKRFVFDKVYLSMGPEYDCVKRSEHSNLDLSRMFDRPYYPARNLQIKSGDHEILNDNDSTDIYNDSTHSPYLKKL